jgi:hypothetical protein
MHGRQDTNNKGAKAFSDDSKFLLMHFTVSILATFLIHTMQPILHRHRPYGPVVNFHSLIVPSSLPVA